MFKNEMPIEKNKLHDQVYDRLCILLREGEFTPGKAVSVAQVAEVFGVSAMPVREALTRLSTIGVLATVSGRSVGVPELGYDELTDLRNVRLEVESLAVKWAVMNRDEAFISDLYHILARLEESERMGDIRGHIKANYEFHLRIYQQSKSEVLIDVINTLWLRVSPHLYQLEVDDSYKASNVHHRSLVESILKGDVEGASEALLKDISEAYNVLARRMSKL